MIDNRVFPIFFSCLNKYNYEFTFVMSHEIHMKQTLILSKVEQYFRDCWPSKG